MMTAPASNRRPIRTVRTDALGLGGSFEDHVQVGSMRALLAGTLSIHGCSGLMAEIDAIVADSLADAKSEARTGKSATSLTESYKS